MQRLIGLCVLVLLAPLAVAATTPPLQLTDYRALVRIASPQFSPDGQSVAFLAVRSNFAHDRYDATLEVTGLTGASPRVLASGLRDLQQPRWSPDGRQIAFMAKTGKQHDQIYVVAATGGKPVQMGNAPNGVQQFAWSPDGKTIAFVTPDNSPIGAKERAAHHDLFEIGDDDYLVSKPPVPSHIWLLTVASGKARQLTHGSTSVLENAPPIGGGISAPSWSADGHWIVYTQQANAHDADSDRTRIVAVNVATGAEHALTHHTSYEYNPRFAPRGDAVTWLYPHGPGAVSDMDAFVGSPAGGAARDISADLDRNFLPGLAWLPDGKGVIGMADNGIGANLYVQPLAGTGHAIDMGDLEPLAFAVSAHGAIAIVADNATTAPELYLLRTPTAKPVALTHFNAGFAKYAKARSVAVTWHAPDGQLDDGILTYPLGYVAGHKYPLVVWDHGGPEAASTLGFDSNEIGPLRDLFAADGYLVFEPNYRGSDNLGNAHMHAIYRDPGNGPDSDVIAGIDLLEKQGIVDTSRIAATGHSYGGYMTTWLIGHQHFWRCAVVGDGAIDWTEEYELSGAGNLAWTRDSLGGSPWDPASAALYRTGSPITYAGDITTPTLILSGTDDTTVPITESFALYHALAAHHVPVKFIGIPGAHHSPQDPVHRELYYKAINDWVVHYLGS